MGRGRYPARLQVEPPPPEVAARYLLIWPSHEVYASPESFPPISSPGLFGDGRPLEIDIGCATGELAIALAEARPGANYLGVDITLKPLYKAVETAAGRGLPNVTFLQSDMLLAYGRIPAGALRAAYVHFPAPLLRPRHRKARLVAPALLQQMQRALVPGGTLSFMTDQPDLYAELLRLLPAAPGLRLRDPAEHELALSDLLKSHYHRRWEAQGRPIIRAELEKC
ncbi:methyltransferase domain-containing protein [Oscillochloris sp. ZM17-4]|uniref:tRNA (guanine(46)-N(7))-methyltransferase TrmB n=1 Tax=Oscillochloris sp. ZM17-4 TaxID=2866714 RepID=UPI001C72F2DB|nr:methyltransferase domain-containing protein [Oscillochloris sp. ZM17-4]MBX0328050.1 methyltransferase domain-containing protein [Oscillochloris sp. ZM17-4]